jgi:pyruvate-formate lyase-activating enzyme
MFTIPYLEMPITHICSLHCDGCSAYSNYNIKKTVALDDALAWFRAWSARISPRRFRILGGEPFLHPHLPEILLAVRRHWPQTHIQLTTNGLNVDRHPMVAHILALPEMSLHISVHSREDKYIERMQKSIAIVNEWITRYGVRAYTGDNVSFWNRFHKGLGRDMQPFTDNDFRASWKVCHSTHCLNLLEGRLWKCPQLGNLRLVAEKFELHRNPAWQPYLSYPGIGLEASDEQLAALLRQTSGPEQVCDMCPAVPQHYEKDIYNLNHDMPEAYRVERSGPRRLEDVS